MKHSHIVILFVLLLTAAQGVVAQMDHYSLINHDTLYIDNCSGSAFQLYTSTTYNGSVNACVIVNMGAPFDIDVYFSQWGYQHPVSLLMWDGDSATGTPYAVDDITFFFQTLHVTSGVLTVLLLHPYSSSVGLNFSLDFSSSTFTSPCVSGVQNLQVSNLTHTSALLQWEGSVASYRVSYGDVSYTVNGYDFLLTNLMPDSVYTVRVLATSDLSRPCCAKSITFRTNCTPSVGCPNFANLYSGSVRGYYGSIFLNVDSVGFVDYGSASARSRHTVHTDTSETDPCTGGQLHTVCPGTNASVRLGNCATGGEKESLEYFLYIDTNLYALLLLRYAVVLQNPGHSASHQPHFRMEVLDNNGNVIDPVCGVADFSASSSLGWNEYAPDQNVWKDWTTVGFDMTAYHGQVVRVLFSTRDCFEGGHYGYAYFCAECSLNSATTEYCGETDTNSITAPDGFDYLWYYDSPSNPVSTEQTVYFGNNDALLHCRLISKENPACYVTLNTYAGHRWPLAIIDTLATESLGCDGYRVQFLNRSVIVNDNGDTVDWHCENALWRFGDAYISYDYSPQHIYHDSGDYTVTLVAGIANNSCRDTTHFFIHIPDFYVPALKDTFACDTFWINGIAFAHDTLGPSYRVHNPGGCDTLYTLSLNVMHSPSYLFPADTFCYSETYTWRGQSVGDPHITDTAYYRLVDRIPAVNGCDSMLVLPLVQLPPDRISLSSTADCSNKKYFLSVNSSLPYLHWTSAPYDTCLDGHESDRNLLVIPSSSTIYTATTDHRDSAYCPTSVAIILSPAEFPRAELEVNPPILTIDHPEFDAHDISPRYNSRWWGIETFPGGGDTLQLSETSARLHYRLPDSGLDSVRVILAVSNDACSDTIHRTLPFLTVAVWAPNVFVPSDQTGANSRFVLTATGLLAAELYIYDRAGRLLFQTDNLVQGWDGTHEGIPCSQGTYVWLLRYRAVGYPDVWQTTTGSVSLLR